ncbi:MAG TPA: hypothetical protein VKR80_07410 [Candidatus Limnocylindria bacterium]|nr:hypothetical protein [Candidatus Limnocylindria bacterium]
MQVTLATLRDRVRQLGNYENSARFTNPFVNDQINVAHQELRELLSNQHQGYFDQEALVITTPNIDWVSLPADFWRLRGVDVLFAGEYLEMAQIGIQERNRYQLAAQPRAYRVAAGSVNVTGQGGTSSPFPSGSRGLLRLFPTPDAAYTLRLTYEPTVPPLVDDNDGIEDWNGWADYVVHAALLRLDERERRPLGDRMQVLERIKERVIRAADERRAGEPEYLIPRVPFHETWRGY